MIGTGCGWKVSLCTSLANVYLYFERYSHLVRFVQQTDTAGRCQSTLVIRFAAFGEFVGLDVLQPDDGLGHYAAVPIPTEATVPCGRSRDIRSNNITKQQQQQNITNKLTKKTKHTERVSSITIHYAFALVKKL